MPLALDLISTLVSGSTFPVATTLLAKSPCSTLANLLGSILVPSLLAYTTPATTNITTISKNSPIQSFLRLFFPFATFPPLRQRFCSASQIVVDSDLYSARTDIQRRCDLYFVRGC